MFCKVERMFYIFASSAQNLLFLPILNHEHSIWSFFSMLTIEIGVKEGDTPCVSHPLPPDEQLC